MIGTISDCVLYSLMIPSLITVARKTGSLMFLPVILLALRPCSRLFCSLRSRRATTCASMPVSSAIDWCKEVRNDILHSGNLDLFVLRFAKDCLSLSFTSCRDNDRMVDHLIPTLRASVLICHLLVRRPVLSLRTLFQRSILRCN